ncbi:conserved hypothetical protein [Frankia canadensis]|uniref:Uncharacterized protein n=1 Tax=Frankia canadensis TaxID=1836972 RepID=A0A2I2KXA0_9ACTN|nr:conserved hypothetical protein [Frankia canadensis]SOU57583.1 conserved hypothetical protein [Frankia canadensis]
MVRSVTASQTAQAFCLAGTFAIGGGALVPAGGDPVRDTSPIGGTTSSPAIGWQASHNANTDITAYVICAP